MQARANRAVTYISLALLAALLVCLPRFFEVLLNVWMSQERVYIHPFGANTQMPIAMKIQTPPGGAGCPLCRLQPLWPRKLPHHHFRVSREKVEQFWKSFGKGKLEWNCPGISTCPLGCVGTRSTSCGTTSSSGSLWQVGFQFQYCEILLGSASWSMDTISNWLSRRNRPHSGSHRTQLQDLHDDEKA